MYNDFMYMIYLWFGLCGQLVVSRSVADLSGEFDRVFVEVSLPVHGVILTKDNIFRLSNKSTIDIHGVVSRLVLVFSEITATNEHNSVNLVIGVT
jgi:hypothetical protein